MNQHSPAENIEPEASSNAISLNKYIRWDSIPALAIIIALFYAKGFEYLQSLYNLLGIPIQRLKLDINTFTAYGGVGFLVFTLVILVFLAASLLTSAAIGIAADSYSGDKKSDSVTSAREAPPPSRFKKSLSKNKPLIVAALIIIMASLFLYIIFRIVITDSSDKAEIDARRMVASCEESTVTLKDSSTLSGCIIAESDDMFYLIKRTGKSQDGKNLFDTTTQPKSDVTKIITPNRI